MTIESARRRVRPRKGLGQHFLSDPEVAQKIAEAASVEPADLAIEVGPGKGALTSFLLERFRLVVGVEIDRELCGLLLSRFGAVDGFHLVNADVMRIDLASLIQPYRSCGALLVGNLPYYIATPLILRLLRDPQPMRKLLVMVQREVALRILADPGNKDYGALTIAVQVAATPRWLFDVSPTAFWPVPRVKSSVIEIDLHNPARPVASDIRETFHKIVRCTFGHRRKMLRGTLKNLPETPLSPGQMDLIACRTGLDLRRRPETLSIDEFERLAQAVREIGCPRPDQ